MKLTLSGSLLIMMGILFLSCQPTEKLSPPTLKIAFGSCNRTDLPQVMWEPLNANNPDVFIWLGDIVYGDTHDMKDLQAKYHLLSREPGYDSLRKNAQIIGTWDDHDYGWNDAGKHYSKKDSSQQLFLDFLQVDTDDKLREREGVYSSYVFGEHPIQTKVILLDARFFRDTVISDPDPARRYTQNSTGDVLGEAQWDWLSRELENSTADIHILGSGIQVIPEQHGWEKWANFPKSQERLFNLLKSKEPKNLLIISGDRHIAEFSKTTLKPGYDIIEVTSSGLTHTWSRVWKEPNRYRIGELIAKKNFGVLDITPEQMTIEIRGEMDSLFKSVQIPLL